MRMYQDERRLDFHALGREIKRKREAKGWTQEYLAQLVDRTPRSIMYFENRGQHPSLNTFYKIITLLDISVDQFFYPAPFENRKPYVPKILLLHHGTSRLLPKNSHKICSINVKR